MVKLIKLKIILLTNKNMKITKFRYVSIFLIVVMVVASIWSIVLASSVSDSFANEIKIGRGSTPAMATTNVVINGGIQLAPCYTPSGAGWTKIADTLVRNIAGAYNATIAKDIYCDGDDTAGGNCILWTDGAGAPTTVCIATDANVYGNLLWDRKDLSATKAWGPANAILAGDIGGTHTTNTVGNGGTAIGTYKWLERYYTSAVGTYLAMDGCKAKGLGWRLPNILELDSIRDQAKGVAPYSRLPNIVSNSYWSSSEFSGANPFHLNFNGGSVSSLAKSTAFYVRCVRGY
jgi:hypothetical protein